MESTFFRLNHTINKLYTSYNEMIEALLFKFFFLL